MLLLGEQDFAASGHDSLDANSLVMVTLRQATTLAVLPNTVSLEPIDPSMGSSNQVEQSSSDE
jgi:hypothetical protein